jgi:hypothetical protein
MNTMVTGAAVSVDVEAIKATMMEGHSEADQMFGDIFTLIVLLKQLASHQSSSVFGVGRQSPVIPPPPPYMAPSGPSTDALLAQVNALAERLRQLETYADSAAVTFAQVGVMSLGDMRAWAKIYFPPGRFGLVPDIFTYYESMSGDSDSDQSKLLIQIEMISKLKLKTGSEAVALYDLQTPFPRMFHKPEFNYFGSDLLQLALNQVQFYQHWSND